MRRFFVWLHRYVGLALAAFLIVEGVTGSLLAFHTDLKRLFDPALAGAPPTPNAERLDLATLIERAEELMPHARFRWFQPVADDVALLHMDPRTNPATGEPYEIDARFIALDPWTGKELKRLRGGLADGFLPSVMPFVYDLHKTLALGETGVWVLSIVALLWTIDCFVGFYLTLPIALGDFWRRWRPAWLIKWRADAYRVNFDLHRAGGLWLWPLLFVFAWSSVNLEPKTGVYDPVMEAIFGSPESSSPPAVTRAGPPALDWRQALARGRELLAEQAAREGYSAGAPEALWYSDSTREYMYRGHTDRFFPKDRLEALTFDGDTGELRSLVGTYRGGGNAVVTNWLTALHMITDPVDYLAYRIFVVLVGLAVAMISVTGVYIWWRKRKARVRRAAQASRVTVPG